MTNNHEPTILTDMSEEELALEARDERVISALQGELDGRQIEILRLRERIWRLESECDFILSAAKKCEWRKLVGLISEADILSLGEVEAHPDLVQELGGDLD